MNKQKKILNDIAKSHGIPLGHADEIFKLFTDKIADTISAPKRMVLACDIKTKKEIKVEVKDGFYDEEEFKTIHVSNFGKFVPHMNKVRIANNKLRDE